MININNFCFKETKEFIEKYTPSRMRENKFSMMSEDLEIYHLFLPKLKEKYYTKDKLTKLEEFLLVCLEDDSYRMEKIIKGDELFMNYREMAKKVCISDELDFRQESLEADAKLMRVKEYEAEQKGISQGISQEKRNMVRNMKQNNEPMEKIMKYTGYTQNEINSINL